VQTRCLYCHFGLILVNIGESEYIVMVLYCGNLHPVDCRGQGLWSELFPVMLQPWWGGMGRHHGHIVVVAGID